MHGQTVLPTWPHMLLIASAAVFPQKISPSSAVHFFKFCEIPQRCNKNELHFVV